MGATTHRYRFDTSHNKERLHELQSRLFRRRLYDDRPISKIGKMSPFFYWNKPDRSAGSFHNWFVHVQFHTELINDFMDVYIEKRMSSVVVYFT